MSIHMKCVQNHYNKKLLVIIAILAIITLGAITTVSPSPDVNAESQSIIDELNTNGDETPNCTITVPTDSTLVVKSKTDPAATTVTSGYNYYNFYNITANGSTDNGDGTTTYKYTLRDNDNHYLSVSGSDYVTYVDLFKKSSDDVNKTITKEMLQPTGKTSKTVDRSLSQTLGNDVGGVLVSINSANYLTMSVGDTYDFECFRQWQAVSDILSNPFIDPVFNYTIMDLEGNIINDVISISDGPEGGLTSTITASGLGTAIVIVTYDAYTIHGAFYGATWPELSDVFVVSVVSSEPASFDSGMTYPNDKTERMIDSELDYLYYYVEDRAYGYSFTPTAGTDVTVYTPTLGTNSITGFKVRELDKNYSDIPTITCKDGTYTIWLTEGRNIVEMTYNGTTYYQILTAMPFDYEIENVTNPDVDYVNPGDTVSIIFKNTHNEDIGGIFNSKGKLAGIYNSGATIYYEDEDGNRVATAPQPLYGDYYFLTTAALQTLTFTVPESWNVEEDYVLSGVGMVINDYGGAVGYHRTYLHSSSELSVSPIDAGISFLPDISIDITKKADNGGSDDTMTYVAAGVVVAIVAIIIAVGYFVTRPKA